jgi:ribonuclease BN (tRNA processing enzyme)
MVVKLWGVRGSSPTPLTPDAVKSKITAVIQRIRPSDLENQDSRELFLSRLPEYLFGTTGGNTACLEIRTKKDEIIVLDCGTGLKEMARSIRTRYEKIRAYHIFFSHFHYDHLLGLPYFETMYNSEAVVHFYSPYPKMEEILRSFMMKPFHPVDFDSFNAQIEFHVLKGTGMNVAGSKVSWVKRSHPNGSFAYKIEQSGRSVIYSSDTELKQRDFYRTEKNLSFFQDSDVIILDAQYTQEEAIEKYDWGHSSYNMAVDFAIEFGIKDLYLFHHEPLYDDKKMASIQRSARWYRQRLKGQTEVNVSLATEGLEIEL